MSRLGAMMFLQFFIWGRGSSPWGRTVQGLAGQREPVATAFSVHRRHRGTLPGRPDRGPLFRARILAVLHLAGAVLMWLASTATSFSVFSACVMGYMLLFMPTLALANSVAMRHMQSPRSSSRWYAWPAASAGSSQAC